METQRKLPKPQIELPKGDEARLTELLRWLAPKIQVYNANGKKSDRFCALCGVCRRLRTPCRHAEVWEFLDEH